MLLAAVPKDKPKASAVKSHRHDAARMKTAEANKNDENQKVHG